MIAAMDKIKIEVALAIFLGFLAGIALTIGVTGRLQKLNLSFLTKRAANSTNLTPPILIENNSQLNNKNSFLDIENLKEDFTATSSFQLKGKTNPETRLLISSYQEEKYVKTDTTGEFSETLTLWPGKNLINIMTLNSDKNIYKEIEVFYFPEK